MKIITAIDVGTNSIKGITAKMDKNGAIEILAINKCASLGVRNGEVIKPSQTAKAIADLKEKLSQESQTKIKEVYASINGPHLYSQSSQGLVSVSRADQKISPEDVQRVLAAAQAIKLPVNKAILQAEPKEFIIDSENGIKNPVGLKGIRLEAKVNLICLFSPVLENLETAFGEAGLEIIEAIPAPLALSNAFLNDQQKELGCCLLEIGASTTSLTVFEKDQLLDFTIFPVGSANITNDIAIGFRTEIQTAENIKKEFANLQKQENKKSKNKATVAQELKFSPLLLAKITQARIGEIIFECQKQLKKIANNQALPAGIVLGGGGCEIKGLTEAIKEKFALPAKKGEIRQTDLKGFSDMEFGVCFGLLLCGFNSQCHFKEKDYKTNSIKDAVKTFFKNFLP